MRTVVIEPAFESWRDAARGLLAQCVEPAEILWSDDASEAALFGDETPAAPASSAPKVSAAFMDMARTAAAHTDSRRWALLYQLLWRHTRGGEKHLLELATDPDVRLARLWCKAVGRDIHKMHAFVRFRLVGTDEESGRERFVAWFEPEHRIVRLAAPFFEKRFHGMDWSILTPWECAHWDGETLHFTPGIRKDPSAGEDALDEMWRTYYRSIFNPARLKVNAMRAEMPKKYWKNLPEAPLIPELIADSRRRVETMLETEERPVKPAPKNAYLESLHRMNAEQSDAGD
jgi:probable DNA metabolism protein